MALLQNVGQLRGASSAVALANQELGRRPALIAGDKLINEVGKIGCVLDNSVKLRWVFTGSRTAIAGGHGVNKGEIGRVEKGVVVVDHRIGSGHTVAVVGEQNAPRAETHVSKEGRRAWAAIVDERNRPLGDVAHVVLGVVDKKEACFGRAVVGFDYVISGSGRVADHLAADPSLMMRHRSFLFRCECMGRRRGWSSGRRRLWLGWSILATALGEGDD